MSKLKKLKKQSYFNLIIILAIIVFINIISRVYHFRLDMTKDKRFSLGDTTKDILNNLDDRIYVKVYLDGELPAGFRRLRESTFELLNEMRSYSNKKFDFEILDPLAEGTTTQKNEIIRQLIESGIQPVELEVRANDQTTNKTIFPGALITYQNKTLPIRLIKDQLGVSPDEALHNSIVGLEYNVASTIVKLINKKQKKIAFIEGHGELSHEQTIDIKNTLSEYYEVERINLPKYKAEILEKFDLIIIAKPDSFFSDLEKYKIDQYVVRGGKIIWLIDALHATMDSLENSHFTSTMSIDLNLNDLFLKYGVRFQPNLIQDYNAHYIQWLVTQNSQNVRSWKKWIFYPLIRSGSDHPIVNNLNDVLFKFVGTIDTTSNPAIKKTILLQSSGKSRVVFHPALIDIRIVNQEINPDAFNKGPQNVAVLIEGNFNSAFTNKLSPQTLRSENYKNFQSRATGKSEMIFISDGDVTENFISSVSGKYFPLGYDYYTNQTFGNKDFMLNCVDYLLDDNGIINLRSKQIKLRLLDQSKVDKKEGFWKTINLIVPVLFLLLFAFVFTTVRKYKYTKK